MEVNFEIQGNEPQNISLFANHGMEGNIEVDEHIIKFYTDGEGNLISMRIFTMDSELSLSTSQLEYIFSKYGSCIKSIKFLDHQITILKNSNIYTLTSNSKDIKTLMQEAMNTKPQTFIDNDEAKLIFLDSFKSSSSIMNSEF